MNTDEFQELIGDLKFKLIKFNKDKIVHKLTHQNLHTTFWVINIESKLKDAVLWENISNFAVPTLIQNFIDKYRITT